MQSDPKNKYIVAVHSGAGFHDPKLHKEYKQVMKQACRAAMHYMKQRESQNSMGSKDLSTEAVSLAISILEDCEYTNAGYGSNLTISGTVECDALMMSGADMMFGAVGACIGVRNPIRLAHYLLKDIQHCPTFSHGRIKPMFLCGPSCLKYAKNLNEPSIICASNEGEPSDFLISQRSASRFKKYQNMILSNQSTGNFPIDMSDSSVFYDTVGAVCVDMNGNMSAGVSSGGIAMKQCGRIGEAAMFGAGCWASNQQQFACSCTGTGESIMLSLLAQKVANAIHPENVNHKITNNEDKEEEEVLTEKVLKGILEDQSQFRSFGKQSNVDSFAGLISLRRYSHKNIELSWGYNTPSIAVAYQSNHMQDSVAFVSTNNDKQNIGKKAKIGVIQV